jgi:hypothetical protein
MLRKAWQARDEIPREEIMLTLFLSFPHLHEIVSALRAPGPNCLDEYLMMKWGWI